MARARHLRYLAREVEYNDHKEGTGGDGDTDVSLFARVGNIVADTNLVSETQKNVSEYSQKLYQCPQQYFSSFPRVRKHQQ